MSSQHWFFHCRNHGGIYQTQKRLSMTAFTWVWHQPAAKLTNDLFMISSADVSVRKTSPKKSTNKTRLTFGRFRMKIRWFFPSFFSKFIYYNYDDKLHVWVFLCLSVVLLNLLIAHSFQLKRSKKSYSAHRKSAPCLCHDEMDGLFVSRASKSDEGSFRFWKNRRYSASPSHELNPKKKKMQGLSKFFFCFEGGVGLVRLYIKGCFFRWP